MSAAGPGRGLIRQIKTITALILTLAGPVLVGLVSGLPSRAQAQSASDYTTYYTWDTDRRLLMKIGPDPDGSGPALRRTEKYTYDIDGQLITVQIGTTSTAAGSDFTALQTVQNSYDLVGNKTQTYSNGATSAASLTQVKYDANNRPLCTAVRMNAAAFAGLFAASNSPDACSLSTAGSAGPDRISKTLFDAAGQTVQTIQALGTADQRTFSTYSYSQNGKQVAVTDANNNQTAMTYDGFDRLIRQNFPVTSRGGGAASASDYEAYSYDANGNRLSLRKRDGAVINFAYDGLNRMATKSGAQIAAVAYAYDLLGRPTLTKFTSGGSGVAYAYDAAGRQVSETGNLGLKVTYAYDKAGNRTGITWPDAVAVAYTYDTAGKMTSVARSGTAAFLTYAYDNLGRRVSGSYGTASVTSYGYDAGDRLTQLGHDLPGTTGDVAYGFSFNPAGQLSGQSVSNPAYVWTPLAQSLTATADGLNRDSAIAVAGGYDANQNLTNDGSRQFGYDGENRLTAAAGAGTTPIQANCNRTSGSPPSRGRRRVEGNPWCCRFAPFPNIRRALVQTAVYIQAPLMFVQRISARKQRCAKLLGT